MVDSPLGESLAELTRFVFGERTILETLTRITDLTQRAVPAAEMVGLTMLVEGRERTAVYTDELAPEIDQSQYESGRGPCLSAFEEGQITSIADTSEPGEWPEFRQTAASHGIASTLSFPLLVDKRSIGALNVYSRTRRAFRDDDRATGEQFAAQAAIVLANSHAYWEAHDLSQRLSEAIHSRAVIEQAKGILMAAQGVDEDAAFNMLVRGSQRENVKLRDIARRIVNNAIERGRQQPGPPPAQPLAGDE